MPIPRCGTRKILLRFETFGSSGYLKVDFIAISAVALVLMRVAYDN